MGYDLLAAIGFAVLLPLVLVGFVLLWAMTHLERTHLEDAWRVFAARRGRKYVPASGEWPNRTSAAVEWVSDGVRFRLDSRGREARSRTRLVAWPDAKLLGVLLVRPRAAHALSFFEKPRGLVASVLTDDVRRSLFAFRQGDDVVLAYRRGRLSVTWPGRETNDARIDEAEALLRTAIGAFRDAFVSASRAA